MSTIFGDQQRSAHMDTNQRDAWVELQKKTFTRWCNSYLRERGLQIGDLFTEISDGILLLNLLEIIGKESVASVCGRKYNKKPKIKIQMLENCNLIFDYVHARDLQTVNISSQDIVDTNPKLVLGLLFIIILRFAIDEDGKQGLLMWCQKNTRGYDGVDVMNFHKSWADGKAFCALINHVRPDLLDYANVSDDAAANLEMAFAAAEQAGIDRLLDVQDVVSSPKPDEKSVIAQLTLYFQAFASFAQKEALVDAINKAVGITRKHDEWINEYEATAAELNAWIAASTETYAQVPNTVETSDVKHLLDDFYAYRRDAKPERQAQLTHVEGLLTQIRTSEVNNGRELFSPHSTDAHHLNDAWSALLEAENAYEAELIKRYDNLRNSDFYVARFTAKAENVETFFSESLALFHASDYGNSVEKCQTVLDRCAAYETGLEHVCKMVATANELLSSMSPEHSQYNACQNRAATLAASKTECEEAGVAFKAAVEAQLEKEQDLIAKVKDFNTRGAKLNFVIDELEEVVDEPYLSGSLASAEQVQAKIVAARGKADGAKEAMDAFCMLGSELESSGRELPLSTNFHALNEEYQHMVEKLTAREQDLHRALVAEQAKQNARESFAAAAAALRACLTDVSSKIKAQQSRLATKASPADVVVQMKEVQAAFATDGAEKLAAAKDASDRQTTAGVFNNALTSETINALEVETQEISTLLASTVEELVAAVAAAESDLSMNAEQAKEVRSVFDAFDSDSTGTLTQKEFIDGAQAIGLVLEQQALEAKYATLCGDNIGALGFEGFASFMLEQLKHGSSKEDVLAAWKGLAGGSEAISADTINSSFADADVKAWIMAHMTSNDQGCDYADFTEKLFSR